jgi:TatA/E family protein of Tat protein translocase
MRSRPQQNHESITALEVEMQLFRQLGPVELILIIVLALIIFGPGRVARLGSELGRGIRGFKEGLEPTTPKKKKEEEDYAAESATDSSED